MPCITVAVEPREYKARAPLGCRPDDREEMLAQLTADELAHITGAHVTSARRWKRDGAPEPVRRLLQILTHRDLGALSPHWRGWRVGADGTLESPESWHYTPGEVRELTLFRERLARERAQAEWALPPPPEPGTTLDWESGRWTYAATPAAPEPLWRGVIEAAREQGNPYPQRVKPRRKT